MYALGVVATQWSTLLTCWYAQGTRVMVFLAEFKFAVATKKLDATFKSHTKTHIQQVRVCTGGAARAVSSSDSCAIACAEIQPTGAVPSCEGVAVCMQDFVDCVIPHATPPRPGLPSVAHGAVNTRTWIHMHLHVYWDLVTPALRATFPRLSSDHHGAASCSSHCLTQSKTLPARPPVVRW